MTTMPAYFKIDGCERQFFRCAVLHSTISTEACAGNFRRAQTLSEYDVTCRQLCRRCPIGAAHQGVKLTHESPFRGASICPRCRKFTGRMIGGTRCISDYNREREFRVGKNAKGTRPTLKLEPRRLGVIVNYGDPDARYVELRAELSRDTTELALSALRVASGRVAFCRALGRPATATADFVLEMDTAAETRRAGVVMFRRAPQAPLARAAPPRGQRPRLPVIDRTPNEARHAPGARDLRAVRERLSARVSA
jgi:hypothetical protein